MQEITDMQQKEVKKVQQLLEVQVSSSCCAGTATSFIRRLTRQASTAAILLRHYAWNAEKLQEQFWNDPAAALMEAGLSPPASPSTSTASLPAVSPVASPRKTTRSLRTPLPPVRRTKSSQSVGPFECPICCCDYPGDRVAETTLALGCEHRFCRGCWSEYLTGKIKGDGESARIQCMASGCSRIVRQETIEAIVTRDISARYSNLLNQAFVADSTSMRWCPQPNCEYIVECSQAPPRMLNQLVPTVTCKCERKMCFGCGYADDHRPVLCRVVKLWEKKCADDSETANWLQANTKECTKCQSTIEKHGGCK